MIEVKGQYNSAIVYQDLNKMEEGCIEQIRVLTNSEAYRNSKIRIMPDAHLGVSSCIGFTCTFTDKAIPATIGVDIGCGVYLVKLEGIKSSNIDFEKFDNFLRTHIPMGREVNDSKKAKFSDILNLKCYRELKDSSRLERGLQTLGGGNHYMELDIDSQDNVYFVVHTGSRNLGKQVADYYQDLADAVCNRNMDAYFVEKANIIETYKAEGRKTEIQKALKELSQKYKESINKVPKDLAWLNGSHLEDYLHDMKICQEYAHLNREMICREVCKFFGVDFDSVEKIESVHNYIDLENNIIRKGSIQALKGQKVIIPVNMRDGLIIGVGKGNPDYNYSAPHGAGRLMSRSEARKSISLEDFKESMKGIFTTSVCEETLDESAFAYKSLEDIIPWIQDTVEVVEVIKPIYNIKSNSD